MTNVSNSAEGKLSRSDLRNFGLILASGILIIFGLLFPWLRDRSIQITHWPWLVSFILVAISLIAPMVLRPLNKVWLFIGEILGYINTRIILGIIYLLVFTPGAIILKMLRKDPMRRMLDSELDSYRIDSNQPKLENLNRPY